MFVNYSDTVCDPNLKRDDQERHSGYEAIQHYLDPS